MACMTAVLLAEASSSRRDAGLDSVGLLVIGLAKRGVGAVEDMGLFLGPDGERSIRAGGQPHRGLHEATVPSPSKTH